jgi:hypothetical protein
MYKYNFQKGGSKEQVFEYLLTIEYTNPADFETAVAFLYNQPENITVEQFKKEFNAKATQPKIQLIGALSSNDDIFALSKKLYAQYMTSRPRRFLQGSLRNCGNSCYINTALIFLYHINSIRECILETNFHELVALLGIDYIKIIMLQIIFIKLSQGKATTGVINLENIDNVNIYSTFLTMFFLTRGEQDDASNFMRILIDLLNTILSNYYRHNNRNDTLIMPALLSISHNNIKINKCTDDYKNVISNEANRQSKQIPFMNRDYQKILVLKIKGSTLQECIDNTQSWVNEIESDKRCKSEVFNYSCQKLEHFRETNYYIINLQKNISIRDESKRAINILNQTPVIINERITIYGEVFRLKGCMMRTGSDIDSGHYYYISYDERGSVPTIINDEDMIPPDKTEYPISIDINSLGYMFLYEKISSNPSVLSFDDYQIRALQTEDVEYSRFDPARIRELAIYEIRNKIEIINSTIRQTNEQIRNKIESLRKLNLEIATEPKPDSHTTKRTRESELEQKQVYLRSLTFALNNTRRELDEIASTAPEQAIIAQRAAQATEQLAADRAAAQRISEQAIIAQRAAEQREAERAALATVQREAQLAADRAAQAAEQLSAAQRAADRASAQRSADRASAQRSADRASAQREALATAQSAAAKAMIAQRSAEQLAAAQRASEQRAAEQAIIEKKSRLLKLVPKEIKANGEALQYHTDIIENLNNFITKPSTVEHRMLFLEFYKCIVPYKFENDKYLMQQRIQEIRSNSTLLNEYKRIFAQLYQKYNTIIIVSIYPIDYINELMMSIIPDNKKEDNYKLCLLYTEFDYFVRYNKDELILYLLLNIYKLIMWVLKTHNTNPQNITICNHLNLQFLNSTYGFNFIQQTEGGNSLLRRLII